jgi:hypothetical protein
VLVEPEIVAVKSCVPPAVKVSAPPGETVTETPEGVGVGLGEGTGVGVAIGVGVGVGVGPPDDPEPPPQPVNKKETNSTKMKPGMKRKTSSLGQWIACMQLGSSGSVRHLILKLLENICSR